MEEIDKIKKLLATAKSPKEKDMYQRILDKMESNKPKESVLAPKPVALGPKPVVPTSKPIGNKVETIVKVSIKPKPTKPLVISTSSEPKAPLEPQVNPLFQAIGILYGEIVLNEEDRTFIRVGGNEYPLLYLPNKQKRRAYKALLAEIEASGEAKQRIIVYPNFTHYPTRDTPYELKFQLVGFIKPGNENKVGITAQLKDFEFILRGLWQFIPVCRTPCISIYKNFTKERLDWVKQTETYKQVKFMKGCHAPLLWKDSSVKPFRFNPKATKEEQGKPQFVAVKAKFLPERNVFGFMEELGLALETAPNYFKASKQLKAKALEDKEAWLQRVVGEKERDGREENLEVDDLSIPETNIG